MKKILNLMACFVLVFSLMAGFTFESNADYESPRVVKGTPVAGLTPRNEGSASTMSSHTLMSNAYSVNDKITYEWEYTIPAGYEEGGTAFDTDRFVINYTDFGRIDGTQKILLLSQKDAWPENLRDRLVYTFSGNKVTFSYTLLPEDIAWMNEHYVQDGPLQPIVLRPVTASKKLDAGVETVYCKNGYTFTVKKEGVQAPLYTNTNVFNFCVDKRTVEIAEEVAPVATDGTVGTYNSNPAKTTYLNDNQEAIVKLTLTRPVGAGNSGDNEVNIKVPDGMTYVAGSMTATSSSGLTVNLTDSATAPKFAFTGLPVGENIVVTYKLKAGTGNTPATYNTSNTLTNLKQKGLTASANNHYVTGSVYSEDEYNTTTTLPLQLNGKYNVTFDSKGGNYTPADQSVNGGSLSTKPADPTKDDNKYGKVVFDNWYYVDANGKEKVFDFSTPIRSNYNLYAKYKEPKLQVTITSDGKSFKPGQEVKYEVKVSNIGTSISKPGEVTFNIPEGMTVKDLDGGTLSQDGKSIVYKFDALDKDSNSKFHPVLAVPKTAKDGDEFDANASITSIDGTDIDDPSTSLTVKSVSQADGPKTGDSSMMLWIFLAVLAIAGTSTGAILKKHSQR